MVVFTCNHCGDSLQKPKVEKHYATVCRTAKFVTCVDCFKDFRNEEYAAHTKCVSEEERYAAKGSLPQGVVKKGEVKQQSWTEMIQAIVENTPGATADQQNVFHVMGSSTNVPRKKAKFINFIKSSLGNRVSSKSIESVWDLIEKAKEASNPKKEDQANVTEGTEVKETGGEDLPNKKKRKSNVAKENGVAGEQQIAEISDKNGVENASQQELPKKKKKSKLNGESNVENTANNSEDQPEAKQDASEVGDTKKKNKKAKNSNENGTLDMNGTDMNISKKKKRKSKDIEQVNDDNQQSETEIEKTQPEHDQTLKNNAVEETSKSKKRKSKSLNGNEAVENGVSQKKKKKENGEISIEPIDGEEKPENEVLNSSHSNEFSFANVILEVLKAKNSISLKKLEKKVLNAYYKQTGTEHSEKAVKKFNKKLKKVNGIEISENSVKLIEN